MMTKYGAKPEQTAKTASGAPGSREPQEPAKQKDPKVVPFPKKAKP